MGYESPDVILYDINGVALAVQNNTAIPASTPLLMVGGSDGTNSRYLAVDSSGRQLVVGAGTAGTPAGGVVTIQGVSGGTVVPISITGTNTISGTVTANIGTTGGLALDATLAKLTITQGTALGTNTVSLMGGSVTTAAPTYTTGNINPLSLTTAGALRIDGSAVTQPVSGTVTANAGTGNFSVVQATAANLNATVVGSGNFTVVQATAASLRSQTASEGSTGAAPPTLAGLAGGSVTTAAPSYTTGQMSALSLTTAGLLRIDGSGVTQPVSGTVTANQGTANTAANAWFIKATDGTNTAAVKAASTAAVATDPAIVVAISPNNSISTSLPDVVTTAAALGALSATVSITTNGRPTVGFQTYVSTLIGTIVPQVSVDGSNWYNTYFDVISTNESGGPGKRASLTFSTTGQYAVGSIIGVGGSGLVRVLVSAYTSGSSNCYLRASGAYDPSVLYATTPGFTSPPTMVSNGGLVTTSLPTYTTGTVNGLSLNTSGELRVIDDSTTPNTATGTIGALNANVILALNGQQTAAVTFGNGLTGSVIVRCSSDNGATYTVSSQFFNPANAIFETTVVMGGTGGSRTIVVEPGATHVQVICSAYTSGSCSVTVVASKAFALPIKYSGIPGTVITGTPHVAITGGRVETTAGAQSNGALGYVSLNTTGDLRSISKITDGTNTAAVKAASTAPLATDPALVVAISPNSNLSVNDGYTSGTFSANGQFFSLLTQGKKGFGANFFGNFVGTIRAFYSIDGGVFHTIGTYFIDRFGNKYADYTGTLNNLFLSIVAPAGATTLGIQVVAYTSGSSSYAAGMSDTDGGNYTVYDVPDGSTVSAIALANIGGLVGTSAPTYTNGQYKGISLNTGGAIRVDASGTPLSVTSTAADTTASGALGALNATVQIAAAGQRTVGMQLSAGTLIGTIIAEVSIDGGTTWNSTSFDISFSGIKSSTIVFSIANTAQQAVLIGTGGASHFRVRVSAYTSGTANIALRASQVNDPSAPYSAPAAITTLPPEIAQIGGPVSTSAPSYTTGTYNAVSLTTGGSIRVHTDDDTTVSGTLGSAGAFVILPLNTKNSAGISIGAGLVGNVRVYAQWGNGGNSGTLPFIDPVTHQKDYTLTLTGAGLTYKHIAVPGGATQLYIQCSTYTSGSSTVTASATNTIPNYELFTQPDGATVAPPTNAMVGGLVSTSSPTYTNGQYKGISLNTLGGLRVDLGDDTSISGTLNGAPQSVSLPLHGKQGAGVRFTGSLSCTVIAQVSFNNGTNTVQTYFVSPGTGQKQLQLTGTIDGSWSVIIPGGATTLILTTASYVSGSSTYVATATNTAGSNYTLFDQPDGATIAPPTNALIGGLVSTNNPTYTNGQYKGISLNTSGELRVIDDSTTANFATGSVGALNANVALTLNGQSGAAYEIGAGLTGTIKAQYSVDGTNYTADCLLYDTINGTVQTTQTLAGTGSARMIVVPGGATAIRVIVSAYTSGSATIKLSATKSVGAPAQFAGPVNTAAGVPTTGVYVGGKVEASAGTLSAGALGNLSLTTGSLLRVDGSGVTQPISASSLPLPTGAATEATLSTASGTLTTISGKLPTSLVGGRLDTNIGSWLGSTAPTVGSKTSANSIPVVIASDQGAISVTSTNTDVSGTGTLTAAGQTVVVAMAGHQSASYKFISTSFVGTVVVDASTDGGSNYGISTYLDTATGKVSSIVNPPSSSGSIIGVAGATHYRIRCSVFTSGSLAVTVTATNTYDPSVLFAAPVASTNLPPVVAQIGGKVETTAAAQTNATLGYISIDTAGNLRVNANNVTGQDVHDAPVTGNPIGIGAYASSTAPTAVSANGDAVRLWADLNGRLQIGDGGSTISIDDAAGSITIDATSLPLPTGAATESTLSAVSGKIILPSALIGGRLDTNVGSWFGSTSPTIGSKLSVNSIPVVIASDQGAVAVNDQSGSPNFASGSITAINDNVILHLSGQAGASVFVNGTFTGTVIAQAEMGVSAGYGATSTCQFRAIDGTVSNSLSLTSGVNVARSIVLPPGAIGLRVIVSAATSGTSTVSIASSNVGTDSPLYAGPISSAVGIPLNGVLVGTKVETSAATQTNSQMGYLSTTTAGSLRVDTGVPFNAISSVSGTLGSLGANVMVPLNGNTGAGLFISSGTLNGTISASYSYDNGINYSSTYFITGTGRIDYFAGYPFTGGTPVYLGIWCPPGATHVQARVTSYTSGSSPVTVTATNTPNNFIMNGGIVASTAPTLSNASPSNFYFTTAGALRTDISGSTVLNSVNSTISGTLGALNATLVLPVDNGIASVGFVIPTGTLVGTSVKAQWSNNSGFTWNDTTSFIATGTATTFSAPASGTIDLPTGTNMVQLLVTAYTSGSSVARMSGNATPFGGTPPRVRTGTAGSSDPAMVVTLSPDSSPLVIAANTEQTLFSASGFGNASSSNTSVSLTSLGLTTVFVTFSASTFAGTAAVDVSYDTITWTPTYWDKGDGIKTSSLTVVATGTSASVMLPPTTRYIRVRGTSGSGSCTMNIYGTNAPESISGAMSSIATTAQPSRALATGGWVTTAAPSYTTSTFNSLSLNTSGRLRIEDANIATTNTAAPTVAGLVGGQSGNIIRPIKTNRIGYVRTGFDTLLAADGVEGSTVNSVVWTQATTTMTIAQATGVLTLNSASTLTTTTNANLVTNRQFMLLNHGILKLSFRGSVTQGSTNAFIELGAGAPSGATAIISNGAFFRLNGTSLACVTSFNGTENSVAQTATLTNSTYYMFYIYVNESDARFIIEDTSGIPILDTSVSIPSTTAFISATTHLPAFARVRNNAAVATAAVLRISAFDAFQLDFNSEKPWSDQLALTGRSSNIRPDTFAQAAQLAAAAAPTATTPINTGSAYSSLGGEFLLNATATSESLLGIFAYTVPSPYSFVITDIMFPPPVITTAMGATITIHEYALMVGSSTNPSTATGQRYPLGMYTAASAAPAGTVFSGQPINASFRTPIVVNAGQVLLFMVKAISGIATGVYRGSIFINGYYE